MENLLGTFLKYKLLTDCNVKDSTQNILYIAYVGNSMYPTLQEPELMEVIPYNDQPVRRGDVIYFTCQGNVPAVVHRVIGITRRGITTRGDNNPLADGLILTEEQVVGKVISVWRGLKRRQILGGWQGHICGQLFYRLRSVDKRLSRWLSPIYYWFSRIGFLSLLIPKHLRPRVIQFKIGKQERLFLFWGNTLIGWYNELKGEWIIRRPFRLITSEQSLFREYSFLKSKICDD